MEKQAQIHVEHTLCENRGRLIALTALGRVVESRLNPSDGLDRGRVSVQTDSIRDWLNVDRRHLVSVNSDSSVASLFTPIVAESLAAIDAAEPDLGWNGFVVGVGLMSRVLAKASRLAGARSITIIQHVGRDCVRLTSLGPGKAVFFVVGQDNEAISRLLSLIPMDSTVVLMRNESSELTRVNFYEGVHRKNVEVVSVKDFSPQHAQRADRLSGTRMHWNDIDLPIVAAGEGEEQAENLAARGVEGVILSWE